MSVLRYAMVLAIGSLSGLLWGVIFVDFIPEWFANLPGAVNAGLLLLPLVVHLVCGTCMGWWKWPAVSIYTLLVISLWTVGAVRNELRFAGNLSHAPLLEGLPVICVVTAMLIGSWGLGRLLRRRRRPRTRGTA